MDVKGTSVDVKGTSVDVKGTSVDVKGTSVDVKGTSVDVKGASVDVKGTGVDVLLGWPRACTCVTLSRVMSGQQVEANRRSTNNVSAGSSKDSGSNGRAAGKGTCKCDDARFSQSFGYFVRPVQGLQCVPLPKLLWTSMCVCVISNCVCVRACARVCLQLKTLTTATIRDLSKALTTWFVCNFNGGSVHRVTRGASQRAANLQTSLSRDGCLCSHLAEEW
eukprot:2119070-Pyramimonas_sp.AAC.1